MGLVREVKGFAGFLHGLPRFVRQRYTADAARAAVQNRLRCRDANFLASVERTIYGNSRSPYRAMLRLAGLEFREVEQLVRTEGVEGTLRTLRAAGVCATFEEFKGLKPLVRGSQVIPAEAADFDNPGLRRFTQQGTGGSTGTSRPVLLDLDHLQDRLAMNLLGDIGHGTFGLPQATWFEIPPGNGLGTVLQRAATGSPVARWFSPVVGNNDGASSRFKWATWASVAVARAAGASVPYPEFLKLEDAGVIARWARDTLRQHGRCVIRGHVSKMLRVCIAAVEEGIDLTGAIVVAGGEPPTPGKVAQIRASGATFHSNYFFVEAGAIGMSCPNGNDPNDQHFFSDHLALIQAPREVPGFDVSVDSFHFTTLLPAAPKILLNVELDDYGTVSTKRCGCFFEELGFTTHLSDIRSYRKLTGEGVTLVGSDMEHVLEQVLPSRFGGSPLDYQMVEEEDDKGFTRLTILVAPAISLPDESLVVTAVLEALQKRGGAAEMSRAIWQQADTLRVRRQAPIWTQRGKFHSLRKVRVPAASAGASS